MIDVNAVGSEMSVSEGTSLILEDIKENILKPTVRHCRSRGNPAKNF
jgi:hypothetical protein